MGISSEREAHLASLEPKMQQNRAQAPRASIGDAFGLYGAGRECDAFELLFSEQTLPRCSRCGGSATVHFIDAWLRAGRIRELAAYETVYSYEFRCACGSDEVKTLFPLIAGHFEGPRALSYPSQEAQPGEDRCQE